MRYLLRNLHIFVFVSFSVFSALFVANEPERTVRLVRPVVEDAVEMKNLMAEAYREVRHVNWRAAADEAVTLYVTTLRMPTLLFERLHERLDEIEKEMSRHRRVEMRDPEGEHPDPSSTPRVAGAPAHFEHRRFVGPAFTAYKG